FNWGSHMSRMVKKLGPVIDRTIASLKQKEFHADPIAGRDASKITSIVSSAYKRHGNILEHAIRERLSECRRFIVWHEPHFHLPAEAEGYVTDKIGRPESIIGNDLVYEKKGRRTLQLDLVVYDKTKKTLRAYEVKRGFGHHDSGKKKQMLRDIMCVQVLLRS